jgi:signal transduction histidine kinase/DNA-binding NarL/FixJ family response regulator
MLFAGTQMHLVTFVITMFEMVILFLQVIYFFERPTDKRRLWYLLLLLFLLAYNVCSGLFPDPNLSIPILYQTIAAFLVGFTMSIYFVYYFYKAFELRELKFFVYYGSLFFLIVPFIVLFVIPFSVTNNLDLSRKMTVVVPFLYGLAFIYATTKALSAKLRSGKMPEEIGLHGALAAYIALICWAALPVIVFFGDFQVLERSVTNAGFLAMTVVYVRSSILRSKREYKRLIASERALKKLNIELNENVSEKAEQLQQMYAQRAATFANLAHETKTPLTLINNYLDEVISKNGVSRELHIVKANVSRLTTDIINFFDIERLNQGLVLYDHDQDCDFSSVLHDKLLLFRSLAAKKWQIIEDQIQPDVIVRANPAGIERIINNIIENAIKFTPEKGLISIGLKSQDGTIQFTVSDTGIGIPDNDLSRIFEPYLQLTVHNKVHQGMGLGLFIVKNIVDELGGAIDIQSKEASGTRITVSLPIPQNRNEVIPSYEISTTQNLWLEEPIETDEYVSSGRKIILIVEDNLGMLSFLAEKLKERFDIMTAFNGEDALLKMKSTMPDLIISDIMMPAMDGFAFARAISGSENFQHIPIVFLTAKTTAADKLEGLQLGAIDYIEKPFTITHLIAKIESIFANLKKQRIALVNNVNQSVRSEGQHTASSETRVTISAVEASCRAYHLTARETQIAELIVKGLSHKAIGSELHIATTTVTKHVSNIFYKINVTNRVELINKLGRKL